MSRRLEKKKKKRPNKRFQVEVDRASENCVVRICERWMAQGKIPDYIHSWRNGQTDKKGMDVIIMLRSGLLIPVQVTFKDSEEHVRDKRERHARLYPNVKVLVFVERVPTGYVGPDEEIYCKVARDLAEQINKIVPAADCIDPDIGEP